MIEWQIGQTRTRPSEHVYPIDDFISQEIQDDTKLSATLEENKDSFVPDDFEFKFPDLDHQMIAKRQFESRQLKEIEDEGEDEDIEIFDQSNE